MFDPNFVLLYVRSVEESAAFYAGLLARQPVESSPGFALFALASRLKLGLWALDGVQPAATPPGGAELAFAVDGDVRVDALHGDWSGRGLQIIQPPTRMDFGTTFVATDPDGHRLRVFAPAD